MENFLGLNSVLSWVISVREVLLLTSITISAVYSKKYNKIAIL